LHSFKTKLSTAARYSMCNALGKKDLLQLARPRPLILQQVLSRSLGHIWKEEYRTKMLRQSAARYKTDITKQVFTFGMTAHTRAST